MIKGNIISVRLNDEQTAKLNEMAVATKLSVSDVIRQLIMKQGDILSLLHVQSDEREESRIRVTELKTQLIETVEKFYITHPKLTTLEFLSVLIELLRSDVAALLSQEIAEGSND